MLVEGMRAVAAWTESVESRNPDGGGEIPVRPAAGAAFAQLLTPSSRGDAACAIANSAATAGVRSSGGRDDAAAAPRAGSARIAAQRRAPPPRAPPRRPASARARRSPRAPRRRRRSSASRPRSTPTLSVMPRVEILQRLDARRSDARARGWRWRPSPGSSPACADDAVHDELELADALAARLGAAARQRRLEHEHGAALARDRFDQRRATCRCRLSSSVVHSIVTRGIVGPTFRAAPAPRACATRDARLHVEDAGAVQPAGRDRRRAACARAGRPARRCRSVRAAGSARPSPANSATDVVAAVGRRRARETGPPIAASRAASSAPQRSTAALSVLGDSSATSARRWCRAATSRSARHHASRRSRSSGSRPPRVGSIIRACDIVPLVAGDARSACSPLPARRPQVPQPFPEAGETPHRRPAQTAGGKVEPPQKPGAAPPATAAAPTEATLGMPIYPSARVPRRRTTPAAASATTSSAPTRRSRRSSTTTRTC